MLGTPLLTDAFHADRWDYVFTSGARAGRRSGAAWWLHFEGDRLEGIDAPDLPTERDFVDVDLPRRAARAARWSSPTSRAQGAAGGRPLPPRAPGRRPACRAPPRTYPPLEPA
jgi:outer membrane protein assembly factor BamE